MGEYQTLQSYCCSAAISSFTITLWKATLVKRETGSQLGGLVDRVNDNAERRTSSGQ